MFNKLINISFSFCDIQILWFYCSKQLNSSLYVMMCWLCLTGLKLQGATCKKNKLQLSTSISTELPVTLLKWIRWVPFMYIKHVSLNFTPFFLWLKSWKYIYPVLYNNYDICWTLTMCTVVFFLLSSSQCLYKVICL